MKNSITFLLLMFSFYCVAQVPQPALLTLKGMGGNGSDVVNSNVTTTVDGGFIIRIEAHNSNPGTGNIDSFCSPVAKREIFVKYNSDASIMEWNRCYGYEGDSVLSYLFPTNDGKYVLGGMYNETGFLICKQDASGNVIWKRDYSRGNGSTLRGMIASHDGGYMMIGQSYYTDTNMLIHYGSWMDADIWILKLDSNGNKMWSKVIGGSNFETVRALIENADSTFYIIGATSSNDFDCTGNHSVGGSDVYIAKLDKSGSIIWHKNIGGTGSDGAVSAAFDNKGGLVIAGYSTSTDGDITHPTSHGGGILILNIDSIGNVIWNNCFGNAYSYSNSICKSTDGSVWVIGVSSHAGFKLDTGYGSDDAWVMHTDSVGNFLNAKVLGGNQMDQGFMIHSLSNGNIIAGGAYEINNGTFSPCTYYGSRDAFLAVFASEDKTHVTNIFRSTDIFTIYPNPSQNEISIGLQIAGIYYMEISDQIGKLIYKTKFEKNKHLDITHWQKGMYCVRVVGEHGDEQVQKFFVK